jgi:large subunit ribosomal protein L24
MAHVKKKDKVMVLSGKDRGKTGEVVEVDPRNDRVLVAKVNFVKKHLRATRTDPAGVREKEAYVALGKVMLVCPKCGKATRAKFDTLSDGTRARACRKCGEMIG